MSSTKYYYPPNATPEQKAAIRRKARAEVKKNGGQVTPRVHSEKPREAPQKPFNGRRIKATLYRISFLDRDLRVQTEYIPEPLAWYLHSQGHTNVQDALGNPLSGNHEWSWLRPDGTNETYRCEGPPRDHALVELAEHIIKNPSVT